MLVKKFIKFLIFIALASTLFYFRNDVINFILNKIYTKEINIEEKNEYYIDYDFVYVKNTNDFNPKSKQDLINIFYTILNSGWNNFSFYCDKEYKTCKKDINDIINDDNILPSINNYVHPFNSYASFSISVNNFGKVNVTIERIYTDEIISVLRKKIKEIESNIITNDMDNKDKIKAVHDYIINNTKYDSEKEYTEINGIKNYKNKSNIAYGPLINGKAICGGYTDAMSIMLYELGIYNFKISNDNHVWNVINLDDKWLNTDLTWDDPLTNTKEDVLTYTFFLKTTDELLSLDTTEHTFNKDFYPLVN